MAFAIAKPDVMGRRGASDFIGQVLNSRSQSVALSEYAALISNPFTAEAPV